MVTAKPVGNNFCGVWRTAQGAALQPRVINRSEPYWPLARTVWPTEASGQAGDDGMEKLLLTVREAADVLSVSRSRVYELLYAEQRACQVLCVTIVVDLDVCGWFCGRSSGVDGVPVLDAVKIVPPVGGCILTAPARRRHGPGWRNGRGVSHRHILGSSRPGKAKLSAP